MKFLLIQLLALFNGVLAIQSDICLRNTFPVMSGGSGNEVAKCMVYDEENQLIIIGGNTLSNDYGPSLGQVGFMYAVDLQGNWRWGNYYYSQASISDITSCSLSSDSKLLAAFGISLGQPVLLTLGKTDGKIKSVLNVEANDQTVRSGALLLDNSTRSNSPVFIISYLRSDKMQMASIAQQND
jgi:hypothetical protein